MSTFKNIQGKNIRSYANNAPNATAGEMWYNRTEQKLKGIVSTEATSSGTPMINKRSLHGFGVGTGTAGLVVAGIDDSTYLSVVEEYNGSGWATGGAYPTARYSAGTAGTQTAAIAYCGRISPSPGPGSPAETYNYDGSSWTSGNSFPTGGNSMQGIGAVNTAVVSTQEYNSTAMHHWNGTSWTAANARNTAKGGQAAFGTQTAAVLAGGYPSESNITEVYDGTNWTSGNTMNTGRNQIAGSGTQTDGLAFGGDKPPGEAAQTTIESWDGTSWATSPATLSTARSRSGTGRNTASGTWIAGGIGPGGGGEAFNATEEYNKSTNVVTAAAWASGGALSTGRESMSSAGTQTAALAVGGRVGPPGASTAVESYNGTAMSGAPSLNTARQYAGGCGTQTAAITYGNFPVSGATEEYDGSSWATQPNSMSTARRAFASFGIQTAALAAGGTTGPATQTATEEYNGTSWTAGGALSQARQYFAGAGIETSGLVFGGSDNPNSTKYTNTEEYGGSSWTAGGALPTGTSGLMGCGATQTAALAFGGYQPSKVTTTVGYDGTAWSTRPSMGGATAEGSGAGTNVAALSIGGSPAETGVEEFIGSTETANIVNITTS